jgi:hypothetical protein
MKIYGDDFELTQDLMDAIVVYMDDDIREKIHRALAPCTPADFLIAYVKEVPNFEDFLYSEFSIEL